MSLVGTRPILQDELQKYELHHRARIAIKPGITGMWQVSGRSDITDLTKGLISTAVMTLSVYIIMQFKLPNTIGLILEISCGVIAYTAVNLVMKNTLIFEIVNKVKGKISHKA